MKKVVILFLTFLFVVSCSSNDDDISGTSEEPVASDSILVPVIKPYSYDVTLNGMVIVYKVSGASHVEAMYKAQASTLWNNAEVEMAGDFMTVTLSDLTLNAYYNILVIAHNHSGKSVTDDLTLQFDYNTLKGTYYMQPFLIWGTPLVNAKKALADSGSKLDSETIIGEEYHLTYQFRYKELKTEYVFDSEQKMKEVLVYFDKERVSIDELRRFISNALGYLAYGNIHINFDGIEKTFPLYRTSEGSSYVIVYERDNYTIVDYICSAGIDTSETLNK